MPPSLTTSLTVCTFLSANKRGWENVLFELGSERVNVTISPFQVNSCVERLHCHNPRGVSCLASATEGRTRLLCSGSFDSTIRITDVKVSEYEIAKFKRFSPSENEVIEGFFGSWGRHLRWRCVVIVTDIITSVWDSTLQVVSMRCAKNRNDWAHTTRDCAFWFIPVKIAWNYFRDTTLAI